MALYYVANSITYALEKALCILDGAARAPTSPFLSDNWAPVDSETLNADLAVEGQLPAELEGGAVLRTGPNPYYNPTGRYHLFDGDGMVHAVSFSGGKATYCNRWVDTARLREEKKAGYAACGKIGDASGFFGLLHILLDALKKKAVVKTVGGLGTANTNVVFHAGKLLALHEGDSPYEIRIAEDGALSTVAHLTFEGKVDHAFTAHPKICPETEEMFAFGYSLARAPYLWLTRLSAKGEVTADIPVPGVREPTLMHDFALTSRYVIFVEAPLFFRPQKMVKQGGMPFVLDKAAPLRLGVLDRYADSAEGLRWFDIDSCMCFHVANAWEVGADTIEVFLCTMAEFSLDNVADQSIKSAPYLTRATLDLSTGQATSSRACDVSGDFPIVPASRVGRPTQFTYFATYSASDEGVPQFPGIAKADLAASGSGAALAGLICHGDGRLGGEPAFVPRSGAQDEDDGYLVLFVHDSNMDRSELVVYDAKTMNSTPVAKVLMPQRVPFGFHGTFVSKEQLKQQT